MKQYTYDELQKMAAEERKKQSSVLGNCCNCETELLKTDKFTTHFLYQGNQDIEHQYACETCEEHEMELLIFCNLLSCVKGTKSWEIFKFLKG